MFSLRFIDPQADIFAFSFNLGVLPSHAMFISICCRSNRFESQDGANELPQVQVVVIWGEKKINRHAGMLFWATFILQKYLPCPHTDQLELNIAKNRV